MGARLVDAQQRTTTAGSTRQVTRISACRRVEGVALERVEREPTIVVHEACLMFKATVEVGDHFTDAREHDIGRVIEPHVDDPGIVFGGAPEGRVDIAAAIFKQ